MPRYNNDGRSAKFLLDTRQNYRMDKMKGIRRPDMKIKLDSDVVMGDDDNERAGSSGYRRGGGGKNKFNRKQQQQQHHGGGRRGGGRNKWQQHQKQGSGGNIRHDFGPGWHKCTVIGGSELSRDAVLQMILTSLGSSTGGQFQPIAYTVNPPNTVFFIENRQIAEAISRITCDALKFRINNIGSPPSSTPTAALEEKLSFELKSRLSPTGHLNLSNFHNTNSMAIDAYLPLYRSSVGSLIGKLTMDWISMVQSVDVSFNRLTNFDSISFLSSAGNIKTLIANDNKLRDLNVLDRLKSLQLSELVLANNPCSEKYTDNNKYVQDVLKKFPNLSKLDNKPIDRTHIINFDIERSDVPAARKSWFCNDSAKNVVQTFVAEYTRLYDSKREDLANAYAEHATMTLSSSYMKENNFQSSIIPQSSLQRLSNYIGESRNLMNTHKGSRKSRLVHVGRNEIIKFISKLPPSKHEEYVVDMPVALEAFIIFTMNGVFREPLDKNVPRQFTRTFTLIPLHGGFVIVNEMFFVTNPTQEQVKSLSSSSRKVQIVESTVTKPLMPLEPTDADKLKMFMEKSRMNPDWARKCLEENSWNYERSIFVFQELAKAGKIPAEAFQTTPF